MAKVVKSIVQMYEIRFLDDGTYEWYCMEVDRRKSPAVQAKRSKWRVEAQGAFNEIPKWDDLHRVAMSVFVHAPLNQLLNSMKHAVHCLDIERKRKLESLHPTNETAG